MPMVASLNSCVFFGSTPISSSIVVPRIALLAGSILPSRFLNIWIRAKVRSTRLVVISSLWVIAFRSFLVGSVIVSFGEQLGCRVTYVSSC